MEAAADDSSKTYAEKMAVVKSEQKAKLASEASKGSSTMQDASSKTVADADPSSKSSSTIKDDSKTSADAYDSSKDSSMTYAEKLGSALAAAVAVGSDSASSGLSVGSVLSPAQQSSVSTVTSLAPATSTPSSAVSTPSTTANSRHSRSGLQSSSTSSPRPSTPASTPPPPPVAAAVKATPSPPPVAAAFEAKDSPRDVAQRAFEKIFVYEMKAEEGNSTDTEKNNKINCRNNNNNSSNNSKGEPKWSLIQTRDDLRRRKKEKVERRRLEAEFAETREDLIAVKTKLNDLPLAEWRDFTNSRHKGLFVIRDIKKRMNPEMCTQAWCKFREILLHVGDGLICERGPQKNEREKGNADQMKEKGEKGVDVGAKVEETPTDPGVVGLEHSATTTTPPHSLAAATPSSSSIALPRGDSSKDCILRTVHLCEAPGAFVTSLNHYLLNIEYWGDWDWAGNTINPYHEGQSLSEMIPDDRLIYNTLYRWEFGAEDVGNLMSRSTLDALLNRVASMTSHASSSVSSSDDDSKETPRGTNQNASNSTSSNETPSSSSSSNPGFKKTPHSVAATSSTNHSASKSSVALSSSAAVSSSSPTRSSSSSPSGAHLVTADGSVNCIDTPADQENVVASLHWCETIAALSLLEEGGTFVIKVFTLFEESSVCLLFLLNCYFDRVEVFKPTTSKAGNSECYVLAKGFRDKSTWEGRFAHTLMSHYGPNLAKEASEMISELVPLSFLQCHFRCIQFFSEHQQNHILENISVHSLTVQKEFDVAMKHILNVQQQVSREFFVRSRIRPISMQEHLVPAQYMRCTPAANHFPRQLHEGSYNERREELSLPWPNRIKTVMPKRFSFITSPFSIAWKVSSAFAPSSEFFEECQVTRGRRAPVCKNSIFCDYQATTDWNLASSCSSLRPEVMLRLDDRVVSGIAKAFVDDLGKYFVQEPEELLDYVLVRDAAFEPSHNDFMKNGGHVVSFYSCVDDGNGSSSSADSNKRSLSEEESASVPKMLQLLRRVFVEKNTLKGSHLLLQLPLLFSRFSASFLYLISSYFDFWGLGVADSFVRDSQDTNAFRLSTSLPSYFFFGANFRLEAENRADQVPLKAVSDFVSLLLQESTAEAHPDPDGGDSTYSLKKASLSKSVETDSSITSLNVESASTVSSNAKLTAASRTKEATSALSGKTSSLSRVSDPLSSDESKDKLDNNSCSKDNCSKDNDPSNDDILQFIPLPLLTDADFLPFIRASNINLIQKRLNFLVEGEKTAEKDVDEGVGDEVLEVGGDVDEVIVKDVGEAVGVVKCVGEDSSPKDGDQVMSFTKVKNGGTTPSMSVVGNADEGTSSAAASATVVAATFKAPEKTATVTTTVETSPATASPNSTTSNTATSATATLKSPSSFSSLKDPQSREPSRRRKRSGGSRRSSKQSSSENDRGERERGGEQGRGPDGDLVDNQRGDRNAKGGRSSRRGSTDDDMPSKTRRKEKSDEGGKEKRCALSKDISASAASAASAASSAASAASAVAAVPALATSLANSVASSTATAFSVPVTPPLPSSAPGTESAAPSLDSSPVLGFDFE